MGKPKNRNCSGCGASTPIGDIRWRGPRGNTKPLCPVCASEDKTPIELLAEALPHVPEKLAEKIKPLIEPKLALAGAA